MLYTAVRNKLNIMNRDCAFQYYNGHKVVVDKTNLTLEEAKQLFRDNYEDMLYMTENGSDIETAIWVNMKDESDYSETLVYLDKPDYDKDGLYEKRYFNDF